MNETGLARREAVQHNKKGCFVAVMHMDRCSLESNSKPSARALVWLAGAFDPGYSASVKPSNSDHLRALS